VKKTRYSFLLEAEQPIAHHSEVFGNTAVLMDRKVRQKDGSFARVPILTGDTLRHGLREASAWALLDAAGMVANPSLTEGALRLLFAGGMVTGRGDAGTIKLDQYRRLAELVPPLRLFGGCCDNRVIPGNLEVSDATLICAESERYWPDWVREWVKTDGLAVSTARSHVELVQRVRMDPTLQPNKQRLLSGEAQKALTGKVKAQEAAHESGDAVEREESKSSMMPRTFECLVKGSLFTWDVWVTTFNDLEQDTFLTALGAFFANPVVGGKRATGHGRIRVVACQQLSVLGPKDTAKVVDLAAPDQRAGRIFLAHVKERAKEIQAFFADVNA